MPGAVFTELVEVANEQYGFLTPEDARELDIDPINLVRMFERGHLERRSTGVYRMRLTPPSPLDAYMEATLWPGRGVRGVLSDETALDLYGLSDVNPAKIDVTVPRAHRIRRKIPSVYRIHHEDLPDSDVTLFEGIPIVTPARAIRQAHASHVGPALVSQAIDQGERNGRLTRREAGELRNELGVKRGTGVRR
ncbi:type IV toxin-antitoxin system AbiEi family antitoxin domain-containing protein [Solirubrobacter soli]|uniref:type IV toxin-antitoxin system AbiEi family antitoxin domain-containing protein n=1 Tax=Solirubrobacter soli TaxID=363832 RepID=UPI0004062959|nr:type IV toxin-antitoxin system AbiEi family antitoxin domain-containing protein [Solirubrobacter soli]